MDPLGGKWKIQATPPEFTKNDDGLLENDPFEDACPIENGDVPASHISFQGCTIHEWIFQLLSNTTPPHQPGCQQQSPPG